MPAHVVLPSGTGLALQRFAVRLESVVQDRQVREVVVDASGVPTAGARVLALVVGAEAVLALRGGSLWIAGASVRLQRVLAGAGLARLLASPSAVVVPEQLTEAQLPERPERVVVPEQPTGSAAPGRRAQVVAV